MHPYSLYCFRCLFDLLMLPSLFFFFFFNDTATTEIYTLSLHDALPISSFISHGSAEALLLQETFQGVEHFSGHPHRIRESRGDRKSTRLNSSHGYISYAVFCLKKKKKNILNTILLHPLPRIKNGLSFSA